MSDETKFTPGPWSVCFGTLGGGSEKRIVNFDVVGPEFGSVASICEWNDSRHAEFSQETIKANAHLIAAAPELYEALENAEWASEDDAEEGGTVSCCPSCEAHKRDGVHFDGCALHAALAKARGESA